MNTILLSFISSFALFLLIAHTLVLLPIKRGKPIGGLDFDTLSVNNITAKRSHFSARDNNKLFYRSITSGEDLVIVLLHGSGAEGQYLLPLAEKLTAALAVTVVVPDLRGHGESALSRLGDITYLGQFEHDIEDLFAHLQTQFPQSKYILAGHSSGGGLAVKFGANSLSKFHGYVLLAPYLGHRAPTVRTNSGGWVQVATLRYIGLGMLNSIGIRWLNSQPVLFFNRPKDVAGPLQADHYSYRLNESFAPDPYASNLQRNKRPVVVLVGQHDEAFYADKFEKVFRENASHAQLMLIPGVKHLDLPNNSEAAGLILAWLGKEFDLL